MSAVPLPRPESDDRQADLVDGGRCAERDQQQPETRWLVTIRPGVGTQVGLAEAVRRDAADITTRVGDRRGFHVSAERAGHQPSTETIVPATARS
jgi:hypothetical protein